MTPNQYHSYGAKKCWRFSISCCAEGKNPIAKTLAAQMALELPAKWIVVFCFCESNALG
jgi:hypothetical protein